jgi:hypothetical protein
VRVTQERAIVVHMSKSPAKNPNIRSDPAGRDCALGSHHYLVDAYRCSITFDVRRRVDTRTFKQFVHRLPSIEGEMSGADQLARE